MTGKNHSTGGCRCGNIACMPHEEMPAVPAELRVFMRDGRLAQIPVRQAKRRLLLDYISQSFEPGQRYSEAEVNAVLRALHDDHAALRRYLVDADFLAREDGYYWRSGGTVEIQPRGGQTDRARAAQEFTGRRGAGGRPGSGRG
jgi:hypothetical protein